MEKFKEILGNKATKLILLIILVILIMIILMVFLLGGSGSVNEVSIVNAAKSYAEAYPGILPKENYKTNTVMLSTLVSSGYISEKASGTECASYVLITNIDGNYTYTPVIRCDSTTTKLVSKITSNTVTSGDGLYKTSNGYIFKGKNPNNYVKFADSTWRIMSIDSNNNIKLIYADVLQDSYVAWDDRYNANFPYANSNINSGINNYSKSNLKTYLSTVFTKYNEKFTGARIARITTHDACVGKFTYGTSSNLCSSVDEDTYVSIITIADYIKASLDSNCSISNSKYCQNDNYLHSINSNCWTSTANGANDYESFYIDQNDGITSAWSYIPHCTKPIITINSNVLYASGTGTSDNPYMFG